MKSFKYVLITPARNEEEHLEKTILSVVSQTLLPQKWVIVSDGSTDQTDMIVGEYAKQYPFIQLIHLTTIGKRNFSSKVNAFNAGFRALNNLKFDYIANIDADISFEQKYMEKVFNAFEQNPKLGICGGIIVEKIRGKYKSQIVSLNSVAGAVQMFRRECFSQIGGYRRSKYGGVDSIAVILARSNNWEVRTLSDVKVKHYRRVGSSSKSIVHARYKKGIINYVLGYHPLFQLNICLYRVVERPYLIGSIAMLYGYYLAGLRHEKRQLPEEVIKFVRREQLRRLGLIYK